MTTITITITIDSQGQVQVGPTAVTNGVREPAMVAAAREVFADELVPLPPEPTAFRGAAMGGNGNNCPVHHEPWKIVAAGISKKTGQPYDSFTACPVKGCNERPRR